MTHYIYIIENKVNGKFYIGRTKKHNTRRNCHFSELRRGVHGNPRLQNAFNKYGEDAFEFRVVEEADESVIQQKEKEWFDAFDCNKEYLYNCHFETIGGAGCSRPHTKEERELVSKTLRDRTRKYIFDILDEGYETKIGLNVLARKHSVGGTTLLTYKPEWEKLRGKEYGHPQVVASIERMTAFVDAYKERGADVMKNLKEFGLSLKTVWKHCADFGINRDDLRLDGWKECANSKAHKAVEHRIKTGCSASEAIKKYGATTTTFYKLWKQRNQLAIA